MKRTVEQRITSGLKRFAEALQAGEAIDEKFTCRTVALDLKPVSYGAKQVKETRELLQTSQAVFAQFLGVSVRTVRAWEQGVNRPSDIACRFLDEIKRNPEYMRGRIRDSIVVKG